MQAAVGWRRLAVVSVAELFAVYVRFSVEIWFPGRRHRRPRCRGGRISASTSCSGVSLVRAYSWRPAWKRILISRALSDFSRTLGADGGRHLVRDPLLRSVGCWRRRGRPRCRPAAFLRFQVGEGVRTGQLAVSLLPTSEYWQRSGRTALPLLKVNVVDEGEVALGGFHRFHRDLHLVIFQGERFLDNVCGDRCRRDATALSAPWMKTITATFGSL